MTNMTIGMAVAALREGKKVRRESWDQEFLYLKEVTFNGFEPCVVLYAVTDAAMFKYPQSDIPYDDVIATDWVVVE